MGLDGWSWTSRRTWHVWRLISWLNIRISVYSWLAKVKIWVMTNPGNSTYPFQVWLSRVGWPRSTISSPSIGVASNCPSITSSCGENTSILSPPTCFHIWESWSQIKYVPQAQPPPPAAPQAKTARQEVRYLCSLFSLQLLNFNIIEWYSHICTYGVQMLVKKLVTLLPPGTSEETIKKSIQVLRAKNGKLSGKSPNFFCQQQFETRICFQDGQQARLPQQSTNLFKEGKSEFLCDGEKTYFSSAFVVRFVNSITLMAFQFCILRHWNKSKEKISWQHCIGGRRKKISNRNKTLANIFKYAPILTSSSLLIGNGYPVAVNNLSTWLCLNACEPFDW